MNKIQEIIEKRKELLKKMHEASLNGDDILAHEISNVIYDLEEKLPVNILVTLDGYYDY